MLPSDPLHNLTPVTSGVLPRHDYRAPRASTKPSVRMRRELQDRLEELRGDVYAYIELRNEYEPTIASLEEDEARAASLVDRAHDTRHVRQRRRPNSRGRRTHRPGRRSSRRATTRAGPDEADPEPPGKSPRPGWQTQQGALDEWGWLLLREIFDARGRCRLWHLAVDGHAEEVARRVDAFAARGLVNLRGTGDEALVQLTPVGRWVCSAWGKRP